MTTTKITAPTVPTNPLCSVDPEATLANVGDVLRYVFVTRSLDLDALAADAPNAESLLARVMLDALEFAAGQVEAGQRQPRVAAARAAS